jgi:hypothetical protein
MAATLDRSLQLLGHGGEQKLAPLLGGAALLALAGFTSQLSTQALWIIGPISVCGPARLSATLCAVSVR